MLALAAALALQTAPVQLPPLAGDEVSWEVVRTDSSWKRRYYPPEALKKGRTGRALIDCLIEPAGTLGDCRVIAEEPAGAGFGEAAVNMRVLFKARPVSKSGQPVFGRRVRLPIRFALD